MSDAVIQTANLTKVFQGLRRRSAFVAVQDVNLSIAPQQVYGFLGPNGAGKSTTIRMLLNLSRPTTGHVQILGQDPHHNPHILRRVGALVEGATFYPYLTAWDNLLVLARSYGHVDEARMRRLLVFVGLEGKERTRVRKFSTGMKQRLGIAGALLHDPELVIFDEPTNGMDPMGIREMRQYIRSLAHEHGKTVFVTSHLLDEIQQMCDRVAIIQQGTIRAEGAISTLLSQDMWFTLEVGNTAHAQQALAAWPTEPLPPTTTGIEQLRVKVDRAQVPDVVRVLVGQGVDVFAVTPYQLSLEEYFLAVVGAPTQGGHLA